MRRIFFILTAVIALILLPTIVQAIEEANLPPEVDTRPQPKVQVSPESTFECYVNSRDTTALAGEMSYVYNLCEERLETFCADEQGVLIVTGEDAAKVSKMIDMLDEALKSGRKVKVKLVSSNLYGGQRKIVGVEFIK